jgi:hypothetical protein
MVSRAAAYRLAILSPPTSARTGNAMLATRSFLLAALILATGAVLHVAVLVAGPEWIAFVGAPPVVVKSAELGTWLAPLSTMGIAALLAVLALYALAAAERFRPLPLAKPVLGLFATIFVLRGVIILPALIEGRVNWAAPVDLFIIASSLTILVLGVALCLGLFGLSRSRQRTTGPRP